MHLLVNRSKNHWKSLITGWPLNKAKLYILHAKKQQAKEKKP